MKKIPYLLCTCLLAIWQAATAQNFPAKPITLIVPFAPGASADGVSRLLAREMSEVFGQAVVVDNRPGSGGAVGLISLANTKPDGYTIGLGAVGAIAVNPHLPNAAPLKPERDLHPIAKVATIPLVMTAGKHTGLTTLQEMIAAAKADGNTPMSYATPGQYTSQHLAGELVGMMAGLKTNPVPYRGSGPAITAVLGQQVGLAMTDLTSAYPHIQNGSLVALGVTLAQRTRVAPELPTLAEAGLPGYEVTGWLGIFAPAGLPQNVEQTLAQALQTILAKPSVQQQVLRLNAEPDYANPAAFAHFIATESQRWATLIRSLTVTQ